MNVGWNQVAWHRVSPQEANHLPGEPGASWLRSGRLRVRRWLLLWWLLETRAILWCIQALPWRLCCARNHGTSVPVKSLESVYYLNIFLIYLFIQIYICKKPMNNKRLWYGEAFNQKWNYDNLVCFFFNVHFATTIESFLKYWNIFKENDSESWYMLRMALTLQRN